MCTCAKSAYTACVQWDTCQETFDCPETFKTVRKFSRMSGNFPDCPETFALLETLKSVQKLSRLSRNFPDSQIHLLTYYFLCWCLGFILWWIFKNAQKTFRTHKNFTVSNANTLTRLLGLWMIVDQNDCQHNWINSDGWSICSTRPVLHSIYVKYSFLLRNLEHLLATIFQPQNAYCIHIDPKVIESSSPLQMIALAPGRLHVLRYC